MHTKQTTTSLRMDNITIIDDFSHAFSILNYVLVGVSIGIICICLFWIWYFAISIRINNRELVNTNKYETVNNECRKSTLKSQKIKYLLFISILIFETLKKFISISEYFYIVNVVKEDRIVTLSNANHAGECDIQPHLVDTNIKGPILIFIQAINLTTTLCLVALIGMILLHLSNMFRKQYKTTNIKGLLIYLATKGVFVLILSSTIWLYIAGYFMWLVLLIIDWILICVFAKRLNSSISNRNCHQDLPIEFSYPINRNNIKECRVIKIVTGLVCMFVLLYVLAQIFSISVEAADLVFFLPCFFSHLGIHVQRPTKQEVIDYVTARDSLISVVYVIVFIYDLTICLIHAYFLTTNWTKIAERLSCRSGHKPVRHHKVESESDDLEKPLMDYEQLIVDDQTYVKRVDGSCDRI